MSPSQQRIAPDHLQARSPTEEEKSGFPGVEEPAKKETRKERKAVVKSPQMVRGSGLIAQQEKEEEKRQGRHPAKVPD